MFANSSKFQNISPRPLCEMSSQAPMLVPGVQYTVRGTTVSFIVELNFTEVVCNAFKTCNYHLVQSPQKVLTTNKMFFFVIGQPCGDFVCTHLMGI